MSSLYKQATDLLALPDSDYSLVRPLDTAFEQYWVSFFHQTQSPECGANTKATLFKLLGTTDPDSSNTAETPSPPITFLAHGSYGAVSSPVLDVLHKWSLKMEYNPVSFFYKTLFHYIVRSQRDVARLLGTSPENTVLVTNVEYGLSAVLKSLNLAPCDCILAFDFTYGAVLFAMEAEAQACNATLLRIPTSTPITAESIVKDLDLFLATSAELVSGKIKLALFEHITSPTALVLPIDQLICICRQHNILSFIDGAHGVGQLDLQLDTLGPDFYVTNPHKWLCNARGCAVLYIHPEHHKWIHPLVITWGANQGMQAEFLWQGTADYSPFLSLVTAIRFFMWFGPSKFILRNHQLAVQVGDMLSYVWGTHLLTSDSTMIGNMVSVKVPKRMVSPQASCVNDTCSFSDLHDLLYETYRIEVPVFTFRNAQYIRVSLHIYNDIDDGLRLAESVLLAYGYPHDHSSFSRLSQWIRDFKS
ncbi:hypothetical protein BASA50_007709 [Batrachochytrium salamandrivorans]|uniref:Aminotransferase class V domain-containing protein n=1 Tax=Batrachochytrium salamandrivorans TaxID=1357716 RepID=A0ABQ8F6C0_9FUNG|nr:hypothetical protein BASA62_010254 [Batrachochytrium salamandrivorans]KAH6592982.1 hypothetical protein BASA50_007709 [Batrachochytrium salamandrivorans]KAH6593529.1 hypothetical protein BASA61_004266 [Batrachochytrium salamandrivorans]KAJ1334911.1 hypothetical protein BSLG_008065 [Batrachochytrium salamandrivorans]